MSNKNNSSSIYYQYQRNLGFLVAFFSMRIHKKMFEELAKLSSFEARTRILDVGVTSEARADCNFFEKLYPYPQNITAVGMEFCEFLQEEVPGLKIIQFQGDRLPFDDKSFDLAVSFATIEHVGSRKQQEVFLHELCRVAKKVCITTPNRWYPVEIHTLTFFIHWLPPTVFRSILRLINRSFFSDESNLNLLSKDCVMKIVPKNKKVRISKFRLAGLVSNFMFYIEDLEKDG